MSAVLVRLLLFLAPFLLFFLWLWVMRHTRLGDGRIYVPAKSGEQGVERGHFEEKQGDDDASPP